MAVAKTKVFGSKIADDVTVVEIPENKVKFPRRRTTWEQKVGQVPETQSK